MVKKAVISAGVFAVAALTAGSVAFAQTSTPAPTSSSSTVTPTTSTSTTMPDSAPSTGRAK